jgi:acyl transferase domain-containing protein
VATNTALHALGSGTVGGALAGGVNVALVPDTPATFQRAGMLSPEGRCKTLDAGADGCVSAPLVS